jgi:hypothetical protein
MLLEDKKIYRTSDYHLATFLRYKGINLKGIERQIDNNIRCNFVFIIENEDSFTDIMKEWRETNISEEFRKTLNAASFLKSELARFFNNPQYE